MKWEKVKLSDVCVSIYDGTHQAPPKSEDGVPFITISNVDKSNKIDFTGTAFVSKEYYDSIGEKRKARKGDILYTVVGSFGIPVYIKEDIEFVFQRHIAILRPSDEIDGKFLYYTMLSRDFYMQADSVALGAAQRTITLNSLRNMIIKLPGLEVQKCISSILSAYDDLIENNQKQIKLLEEAAQRLYREWFVDLRFPGYEDVEIVDGLPSGWEKVYLDKIAPIVTGKKDANFGTEDGEYLFFTCSQEPLKAPSYSFDCASVILAGNGDFNVKLYRGKFEAYQRTYIFSPNEEKDLFVLYFAVKDNMRQLFQGASGSTIKFLTKGMLEKIEVIKANDSILKLFNDYCFGVQEKIEILKKQIDLTREARDRLLPKLMSGEVEV